MSAPEIASRFVEFNGLTIHYDEAGAGPALIFLHGGGPGSSGLNTFSRNLAAFADRCRVIAIDLPGLWPLLQAQDQRAALGLLRQGRSWLH